MTWEDILKKPYFTDGRLRAIERKIEDRQKKELEVKRQSSKKVRDAQRRKEEEEFDGVTDSPSFGQPQPTGKTQQRKGTVGVRRSRNTPSVPRRGRSRKFVPKNPFSLEGDKK